MLVSRSPSDMPMRCNYASLHARPSSSSGANAALGLMMMVSPSYQRRDASRPSLNPIAAKLQRPQLSKTESDSRPTLRPLTISLRAPEIETQAQRKPRVATPVPFYPDRRIQKLFKRYPYAAYAKSVTRGFIRRSAEGVTFAAQGVPVEVAALCSAYYVDAEEGAFQIALKVHCVLKRLKQRSITTKMLTLMLTKYLRLRDASEAEPYRAQLEQLEYIVPVKQAALESYILKERTTEPLFQIPMDKMLLFGSFKAQ